MVRGAAVARPTSRARAADPGRATASSTPATSPPSIAHGYMQITDRAKDVIKSGGEWISSIEIENLAVGHPKVAEAAVIGVAHPKWDERPLLIVIAEEGREPEHARRLLALPRGQDRQVVDAGRRGLRRRDPAHRDGQDPEDAICASSWKDYTLPTAVAAADSACPAKVGAGFPPARSPGIVVSCGSMLRRA